MRALDLALLTLLLTALLVWPLRTPPIATHGEAREALVVDAIVDRGEWVLARRNGELASKPPLFHWIAAVAAHAVGCSDAVVRLPSALAAWAMTVATFGLGASAGGRVAGWLGVGALLGTHGFWESATQARVDMVLAAAVTVALAAFVAWYRRRARWQRAACYAAAGLAVLAKGPVGLALPVLVIGVFLALQREPGVWRALWSWRLATAVLLLDLGWYVLATRVGGDEFLARQVVYENLDRFLGRGAFATHRSGPVLELAGELATDLLPWNLVLVAALVRRLRGGRAGDLERFLHVWWIVVLAFFTLGSGKRSIYLLPLHPPIAVLAAVALAGLVARLDVGRALARRTPRWLAAVAPERRALVALGLAIALFDLVLLGVMQTVRVHRAGVRSLGPFAEEVAVALDPAAPLRASPGVQKTDVTVLAYRLDRPIRRAAPAGQCAPAHLLVPRQDVARLAGAGWTVLAASARRGPNVALVRAPPCPP